MSALLHFHRPTIPADLHRRVEAFLHYEAYLLDQARFEEWNELFCEDGMYWMPLTFDQPDPIHHASLFYENAMMREVRVRRLRQQHAWSQQPRTHTARLVGNIIAQPSPEAGASLFVHSTFHLMEWRKGRDLRLLGGSYQHTLVERGESWRIKLKRVDLISRDGPQEPLEIFA
jgi:benzoate/toluate 1,2-dioxygenase beta subunit